MEEMPMKRNTILILFLATLFLLESTTSTNAFFNRDVKKAKAFMQVGLYTEAIELLNNRINQKPTGADAYFLIGACYLHQRDYNTAAKSFKRAVKIDSAYGQKIGLSYKKAGDDALQEGRVSQAQNLYSIAVKYQNDLKNEIAQQCFAAGEAYLNKYQSETADNLLAMAVTYNPSLAERRDKVTRDYANALLAIAKDKPREERKKYVDEARKYLDQTYIGLVFPSAY
jgi:tetratricopeptide (TPR) repeat protein